MMFRKPTGSDGGPETETTVQYPKPAGMQALVTSYTDKESKHETNGSIIRRWKALSSGWRGGLFFAVIKSTFVLLLNIAVAIVAASKWGLKDNIATMYKGNCDKASWITIFLGLLINIVSSVLLGASNYCMQRLAAPNRKEVDAAHAKKVWLDIGMGSIRNLGYISKGQVLLWALIGLSSVPLHFLYNSVIFKTVAVNDADFLVVRPSFFTDKGSWRAEDGTHPPYSLNDSYVSQLQDLVLDGKFSNPNLFENLTGPECNTRYLSQTFITDVGVGFAVPNLTMLEGPYKPSGSLLESAASTGSLKYYVSGSTGLNGEFLSYCISQKVEQKCEVQLSFTILLVVIACNIIKIALLLVVVLRLNHATLVTIGDAIESFIRNPDPYTEDCCLMSSRNVDTLWRSPETRASQKWQPRRREPWYSACSRRRWLFSIFLYIAMIIIAVALLGVAHSHEGNGSNGFGEPNTDNMIKLKLPYSESIISWVLLANLPQTLISFLYLTYNGLFTCMLAGREWASYAVKRSSLRVSVPRPGQRSTYNLSLPYKWGIPLSIGGILIHWFLSQSIFLVRVIVYKNDVPMSASSDLATLHYETFESYHQSGNVFTGVGYSDVGLVVSICVGSAFVIFCLLVAGICTYPKGLPIGGTNSAVISAACHLRYENGGEEQEEEEVTQKPLMWGVTIPAEPDRPGHCCFTDKEVEDPREGCLYAGLVREKWD